MYIEAIPNRNSPPAVLLRETYREGGKIKKRTLLNLTSWPAEQVEGLRIILKGGTALPPGEDPFAITRSLPHGHVAAILGTICDTGLDQILGPEGNRPRGLVLAMIVSRARPRLQACHGKNARRADSLRQHGEGSRARAGGRPGALRGSRLAARPPARRGEKASPKTFEGRLPGALRRLVELCRWPLLRTSQTRLQPRRQTRQAADRLWASLRRRWLPRGGGSVRGKHGRSQNACRTDRQAEAALQARPGGAGQRPRHDHRCAYPRGVAARRA